VLPLWKAALSAIGNLPREPFGAVALLELLNHNSAFNVPLVQYSVQLWKQGAKSPPSLKGIA
jgi:hypothetical protein